MKMNPMWEKAYNMGKADAEIYASETDAVWAMGAERSSWLFYDPTGEYFQLSLFYHAGFIGREPEWVEAIRYGEIPECGRSMNYADHTYEHGVSCVKIIRNEDDADCSSIYDVILGWQGQDKIRIAGWYLGGSGSDGEPLLVGAVKI